MRKGVGSKLSAHPLSRPRSHSVATAAGVPPQTAQQHVTYEHNTARVVSHNSYSPSRPDFSAVSPRRPTTGAGPPRDDLSRPAPPPSHHHRLHRPSTSLPKPTAATTTTNRGPGRLSTTATREGVVQVELPGLSESTSSPSSTSPTKSTTPKANWRSRASVGIQQRPYTASVAHGRQHPDDPDHRRHTKAEGLSRRSIQG
jgi:hypothetical protein